MNLRSICRLLSFLIAMALGAENNAVAQQYKLRQVNTTMGMKSESTIYVKGMRKRIETTGYMGMWQPVQIEQCDLHRTIRINDKKKLYYIEPFSTQEEIEEERAASIKPAASTASAKQKSGGVITMWSNVVDTGERKKIFGLTARRLWTTQKMLPSPDACTMKDSMVIKTDGWYIDLPAFACRTRYTPAQVTMRSGNKQAQCTDRFVSRKTGKGKLGFPLSETKTMTMGDGSVQTSTFESTLETLELTNGKLDSMLFEIPPGYKKANTEDELLDQTDVNALVQQAGYQSRQDGDVPGPEGGAKQGSVRIGVYPPESGEALDLVSLQQHLVIALSGDKVEAVAVASEDAAREAGCGLVLTTNITKVKQGNKVGGLIKAIKNADPSAASSLQVEAEMILSKLSDGSVKLKERVDSRYDGKPQVAVSRALDEGCSRMLEEL